MYLTLFQIRREIFCYRSNFTFFIRIINYLNVTSGRNICDLSVLHTNKLTFKLTLVIDNQRQYLEFSLPGT